MTLGAKHHTDLGTNFDDKVNKTWPGQATWAGTSEVGGQCHQSMNERAAELLRRLDMENMK